jgi:periplasmic copper chaperone A
MNKMEVKLYRKFFIFLATLLLLAACATPATTGPKIRVESAWARPAVVSPMVETSGTPGMQDMPGMSGSETPDTQGMSNMPGMSGSETNSAVYFVIINDGDEADTLIGVASEVASSTEMHETRIENDVAQMVPVPRVDVPAHGSIEFKPGGYHVMLVGLTQDLKEGNTLKLTLQFEKSGAISVDVPIRPEQ